jgi:phosphoribosylformylglycinamidine cyclo-ligase
MSEKGSLSYKSAGVDLDIYRDSMSRLPKLMQRTFSPRVQSWPGGFAGLFQLDFQPGLFARNYEEPVLVAGSDGVGTKLAVASLMKRHDTIGIDLVAMCVNDVICCGAEPLFFLDYVAMSHDDPQRLEEIVKGISDGCVQSDCALLGGETAIMPGLYQGEDYDLAGFCVGVVEKKNLIQGQQIQVGDAVIGIGSAGFHSNGYSLVRKTVFEHAGLTVDDPTGFSGETVGECLLRPTKIYARLVRTIRARYKVKKVIHGMVHITGGGLPENIDRVLPTGTAAEIDTTAWTPGPEFAWLQSLGGIPKEEMFRVFNMGIGFVLIVSAHFAPSLLGAIQGQGFPAWEIGKIVPGNQNVLLR